MADNRGSPWPVPRPCCSANLRPLPEELHPSKVQGTLSALAELESNGNTDQSCSLSAVVIQEWQGKKGKESAHFSDKASPSGITSKGK